MHASTVVTILSMNMAIDSLTSHVSYQFVIPCSYPIAHCARAQPAKANNNIYSMYVMYVYFLLSHEEKYHVLVGAL